MFLIVATPSFFVACNNDYINTDHIDKYIEKELYENSFPTAPVGFMGEDDGLGNVTWKWTEGTKTTKYSLEVFEGMDTSVTAVISATLDSGTTSFVTPERLKEDLSYTAVLTSKNNVGEASSTASVKIDNIIDNAVFDRDGTFVTIFNEEDMTCTISGFAGGKSEGVTELVIPHYIIKDGDEQNPYLVTAIADGTASGSMLSTYFGAFSDNTDITSITLPQTLEVIGRAAFAGCENVRTINFRDCKELVRIKDAAFRNIRSLEQESIDLSQSTKLTEIYAFAFYYVLRNTNNIPIEVKMPSSIEFVGYAAFWCSWGGPTVDATISGADKEFIKWYAASSTMSTSNNNISILTYDAVEGNGNGSTFIASRAYSSTDRNPLIINDMN